MNATAAIQTLRAMLAPRELSPQERAALVALRGQLFSMIAIAQQTDELIAEKLRGIVPAVDFSELLLAYDQANRLLDADRKARGLR